ncbi:MAG: hypothetical protein KDE27_17730 [Planctomycetes bacterium]|nr:hypothetical protein [Planctomycetota bacterium]
MRFAAQRPLPFTSRPLVLDTAPRPRLGVATAVVRIRQARDPEAEEAAQAFVAKRIRHSLELAASCILIAAFVVLALFA